MEMGMAFQISITRNGSTKVLKNPLTNAPHEFDARERAQTFADSCLANQRCDYRNQGKRLPKYEVFAA